MNVKVFKVFNKDFGIELGKSWVILVILFLRILTEKKHPQIKPQRFRKV